MNQPDWKYKYINFNKQKFTDDILFILKMKRKINVFDWYKNFYTNSNIIENKSINRQTCYINMIHLMRYPFFKYSRNIIYCDRYGEQKKNLITMQKKNLST